MGQFDHSKIISDLKELIILLKKYEFQSTNSMELYRLDNIIGHESDVFYKYKSDDIVFNITTSGMNAKPSVKRISVIINTEYTLKENLSDSIDAFNDYSLQIHIKGYDIHTASTEEFSNFFCWHLDKETNTDGNLSHPYYHFHAGGNLLHHRDIGDLLMLSSPRIPHPPMDIFLSIHFIICNFFYSKDFIQQKKILLDDDYIMIIERAQKRILDPYFSTLSGGVHTDFSRHSLFPLIYS